MNKLTRRTISISQDYAVLLAMQQESYKLNFPGEEMLEGWFRAALEAAILYDRVWVYEQDAEIVGWLWVDWDDPRALHINHVQVKSSCWGQGIGRMLIKEAAQLAQQHGKLELTLNVTKSNVRALTLYEHLGFVLEQDNGERQAMRLELIKAPSPLAPQRSGYNFSASAETDRIPRL
ncbi:MAG: GNAT family N-acetyltransferase [Anaerolineae bacterium]